VAVNCGLAHDELLAAELFGYVEGAFTGARKGGKKGQLELAHGGTLFLDEVETMPAKMQVSLLRVLEEGQLTRVGAERPIKIEVRIIAASNEDLQKAIAEQRFRLDLYHRLCVFPIALPPLRARTEDLAVLARYFLKQLGYPQLRVTPEALAILRQYDWPGNIRELKHVLLRAVHQADGTLITPAALPPEVIGEAVDIEDGRTSLRDTERELIQKALAETNHNIGQAAAQLGIHRATLYRKLKRYDLSESDS
jgi:transcriptional regulator with PAS, ATPase and Fis domain